MQFIKVYIKTINTVNIFDIDKLEHTLMLSSYLSFTNALYFWVQIIAFKYRKL